MNYVPLHCHTDASPDGAGTVQALVERARAIHCPSLAMTDHGTLANAVAFWSACDEAEIKPILGMEAYLLYEGRRHHLTLLSLNEEGFNNLVHLDTESHTERYIGGYPLITLDALHKRNSGLVALTGCASSAIYHGEYEDALRYAGDLTETLGKENVLAEVMFV